MRSRPQSPQANCKAPAEDPAVLALLSPVQRLDAVALSPDGRELAAGGVTPGGGEAGVCVWTLGAPAAPRRLLAGRAVAELGYSADARWLLAGTGSAERPLFGGLFALDRRDPARPPVHLRWEARFATAGDRLVVCGAGPAGDGYEGRIACRRLTTARPFGPVWEVACGADERPEGVALLPDGRAVTLVVVGVWGQIDRLVLAVRAAATGRPLAEVVVPGKSAGPLAASPDGERVLLNAGNSLFVWRTDALDRPPVKIGFGRKHCTGAAFLPDGSILAAGNDGDIRRLDPAGRTVATLTSGARRVRSLAVAPDGLTAAAGTDSGRVVLFDLD